jgi:hypothetical protein
MSPTLITVEVDTLIPGADGVSPPKACPCVTLLAVAVLLVGCGTSPRPQPSSSPCVALCLEPISVRPLDPVPPIIVRPLLTVPRPPLAQHRPRKHHHSAATVHRAASSN